VGNREFAAFLAQRRSYHDYRAVGVGGHLRRSRTDRETDEYSRSSGADHDESGGQEASA
jgi:hypothetical protein